MENKIDLIKEKSSLLQQFLDAAKKIHAALELQEEPEKIDILQTNVDLRDSIIQKINSINSVIDQPGEPDDQFHVELEKNEWLWEQLLGQIQQLDQQNSKEIESVMKCYQGKVKSAKDSIKVVDAYSRQMVLQGSSNIDKNR